MSEEVVKLVGQNKWLSIAIEPKLFLAMIQKVAKIDVEELSSCVLYHKIARMSISNSKNVCSDTLPSKRPQESLIVMSESLFNQ